MVWRSKRAAFDERRSVWKLAGDAVEFGRFKRLVQSQRGKDAGNPFGDHAFAASRRSDHHQIVTTGNRHLNGTLDAFLAPDVGEVEIGLTASVEQRLGTGPYR